VNRCRFSASVRDPGAGRPRPVPIRPDDITARGIEVRGRLIPFDRVEAFSAGCSVPDAPRPVALPAVAAL
jgi:hypothetical protein